jgi:hypothetical protein
MPIPSSQPKQTAVGLMDAKERTNQDFISMAVCWDVAPCSLVEV